jgi:hypothetical protein
LNYQILDNGWMLSLDAGAGLGLAFKGAAVEVDLGD